MISLPAGKYVKGGGSMEKMIGSMAPSTLFFFPPLRVSGVGLLQVTVANRFNGAS